MIRTCRRCEGRIRWYSSKITKQTLWLEHRESPGGLPSKRQVRRANTRDYIASRCALLKYASAGGVLKEARGPALQACLAQLREGMGSSPAAKPRVTDTLISIVFAALRCNQARADSEQSFSFPGRQRRKEPENEGKVGA